MHSERQFRCYLAMVAADHANDDVLNECPRNLRHFAFESIFSARPRSWRTSPWPCCRTCRHPSCGGARWRRPLAPLHFLRQLGHAIPAYASIREAVSGLLTTNTAVIVSYWIPLAVATIAMMLLLLSLARYRELTDAVVVGLLFRWSVAFAAACSFAFPLFTQDLWLSAVWGRMIVAGVNPYHNFFTPESLEGLPIDHFPMVMSYGPLWGLLSGAVMAIAGDSVLTTAIVSKGLLAAAWIGSLVLVRQVMAQRSSFDRCLAVALFGWAPVGVTQSLAEGHNDIVMTFFALLWLSLLLRGRRTAPIALISSALCKYTTAPLFLIDAIYVLRMERIHWRDYMIRLIAPALLALLVFAVFFRSPAVFRRPARHQRVALSAAKGCRVGYRIPDWHLALAIGIRSRGVVSLAGHLFLLRLLQVPDHRRPA